MRNWSTSCGLLLGFVAANLIGARPAAAADVQHKMTQIKQHAERTFKLLDTDHDGTIAGDEMANLAVRVQRDMRTLRSLNVIGGTIGLPAAAGVQTAMTDHAPLTLPEFTDAFLAEAVRLDGEVRAQRVARARLNAAPAAIAAAPGYYGYGKTRQNRFDDDPDRERERDREIRERERERQARLSSNNAAYGPRQQYPVVQHPATHSGAAMGGSEMHAAGGHHVSGESHHARDQGGDAGGGHHHGK